MYADSQVRIHAVRAAFTDAELAHCAGPTRSQRLAARFAAKESVIKTLGIVDESTITIMAKQDAELVMVDSL